MNSLSFSLSEKKSCFTFIFEICFWGMDGFLFLFSLFQYFKYVAPLPSGLYRFSQENSYLCSCVCNVSIYLSAFKIFFLILLFCSRFVLFFLDEPWGCFLYVYSAWSLLSFLDL